MTRQEQYRGSILSILEGRGYSLTTRLQYASLLLTMAEVIGTAPDPVAVQSYVMSLPPYLQAKAKAAWNALHPEAPFERARYGGKRRGEVTRLRTAQQSEPGVPVVPVPIQSALFDLMQRITPEVPLPVLHALTWETTRWDGGSHPWFGHPGGAFAAEWRHPQDRTLTYRLHAPLTPLCVLWRAGCSEGGVQVRDAPTGSLCGLDLEALHRVASLGKAGRLPLCLGE